MNKVDEVVINDDVFNLDNDRDLIQSSILNSVNYLNNLCRNIIISSDENKIDNNISNEVSNYLILLDNIDYEGTNYKKFWLENKKNFPNLYNLALRLFSIPASTAEIERFFSVTGNINKKNCNTSDKLLIERALLKVNLKLIDD